MYCITPVFESLLAPLGPCGNIYYLENFKNTIILDSYIGSGTRDKTSLNLTFSDYWEI